MPRVTVNQPQAVKVQVNSQQKETVQSLSYGVRTIKGSTDLSMQDVQDQDVIVYVSSTNSFVTKPVVAINMVIDNGFF